MVINDFSMFPYPHICCNIFKTVLVSFKNVSNNIIVKPYIIKKYQLNLWQIAEIPEKSFFCMPPFWTYSYGFVLVWTKITFMFITNGNSKWFLRFLWNLESGYVCFWKGTPQLKDCAHIISTNTYITYTYIPTYFL